MLPYPSFDVLTPSTIAEAVRDKTSPNSLFIAGGTDLGPSLKHRLFKPKVIISLHKIEALKEVFIQDKELHVGAMCSLISLQRNPLVKDYLPVLSGALSQIGTHTIQNMGTIGGNVMLDTRCLFYNQPEGWRKSINGCLKADGSTCHVVPKATACYAAHSADSVPLLWLMGAKLSFHGTGGSRIIPLDKLYGPDGRTWLKKADGLLLEKIIIPLSDAKLAHRKTRLRASIDYAQLLVAVRKDGDKGWAVISAVSPQPVMVQSNVEELPEAAYRAVQPLKTHAPLPIWRRHMIRIEVKRALEDCQ
jgi:4-hydroxybenzoyl-CoA reductase subunit beta